MEALKAEIAAKRKALETDPVKDARPTKYLRRGEVERLREEQLRKEKEEKEAAARAEAERKAEEEAAKARQKAQSRTASHSPMPEDGADGVKSEAFNISAEETVRRLRAKGQPIRLFGESDKERRLRLRALELIEEKEHDKHGGQNDFRKALEEVESRDRELKAKEGETKDKKKTEAEAAASAVLDLGLVKTDPKKLYPIIYHALKRMLKDWEEAMDERPESVKRTHQGKLAAATQKQSAEYLKPLFKILRQRELPDDVLARLAEIVHYTQKRQYQKANDAYLRLSIGNAPWPIGVTMVGIHERSAREKISADQVAHVLNDEVSRKYIQSLKRLITFSQTKYPPEDVSQLMG
ncbi:Prp18-domain-containing protein [Punctularia strigosozonata HHB-11173 SS5]|uniref:Pre-mRNA-splicing factor 18 n=1 Tax=Punctularia strigosozonata (strain HHB-11173) TaxID=741275 RepID=R7S543_PUNST|nr:Prp18-domain-containing protein [Punctularia strigosozonata HHB-11173 SS5]EIN04977.1 Prp18-domain-containing protein [Punctularia strigosozonata HHB-11173 SS5]